MACRPGAAPDLGGFGDLPAQAGARHVKWCGQPAPAEGSKVVAILKDTRGDFTAVRSTSGISTMASSHLGYWTMAS